MNEYELAVNLFDKAVAELDGNGNELLSRFRTEHGIDENHPLSFVFGGFVLGLDSYAKLVETVKEPTDDADQDMIEVCKMLEKLPRSKINAVKALLKEMI